MHGKAGITVGAIIIKEDKVLLVKHTEKSHHKSGIYGLPSGRPEPSEDLLEALIREVKEETGLDVKKSDLIRLNHLWFAEIERKDGKKIWSIIPFIAKKFSGSLSADNETIPEWISIDELDKLDLLPNVKEIITDARALQQG
ncbi:MAG: NUDIX hydrolase [Candidatus Aenigmarchaeota archaeon]|nr:NUDIX hydrolase [Candidatus Aenigmarchaeota archaeon]